MYTDLFLRRMRGRSGQARVGKPSIKRLAPGSLRYALCGLFVLGFLAVGSLPRVAAARGPMAAGEPASELGIRQVSIDKNDGVWYIKGDGIYSFGRSGPGSRLVVAAGDEAPGTGGGRFVAFWDLSAAVIDVGFLGIFDDPRVAFRATIEGGTTPEGIFMFSQNEGFFPVALVGDIAPDTGGGAFSEFPGQILMSPRGTIMFRAKVTGGQAKGTGAPAPEGLFFAPREFFSGETNISSVAIAGQAAGGTGGGSYASFGAYALHQATIILPLPLMPALTVDRFLFIANVEGGRVPQAVYLSTFVVLQVFPELQLELRPAAVAAPGDAAPIRGFTYTEFEDVVLTREEVVFRAKVTGVNARSGAQEVTEGIFQQVVVGPIELPLSSPRVMLGDRAPIPRTNVRFARFGRMVGSNASELVFEAALEGNGPSQGLFSVTLGPLNLVSETLSSGDTAPGTGGGVYDRIGPLALNESGLVVFQSTIRGGHTVEAVYRELAKRVRFIDGIPNSGPTVASFCAPSAESQAPSLLQGCVLTVDEGTTVRIPVPATDPNQDDLGFFLTGAPPFIALSLDTGTTPGVNMTATLVIAPGFTDAGTYPGITLVVREKNRNPPLESSTTFSVVVNNVNQPPLLAPINNQAVNEGQVRQVSVQALDPDGDPLQLTIGGAPPFVQLQDNGNGTGVLRIAPGFEDAGLYEGITVTATDASVPPLSTSRMFAVLVNNVNRPPLLSPIANQTVDEGQVLDVAIQASDPDRDAIELSLVGAPSFVTLTDHGNGTGLLRLNPDFTQAGIYPNVRVTARDNGQPPLQETQAFIIVVNNVNRAPALSPIANQTVDEGQVRQVAVSASDPDGDRIQLSLGNAPPFVTLQDHGNGTGTLRFAPGFRDGGVYPGITVIAQDDGAPRLDSRRAFDLVVNNINRAPTLAAIPDQLVITNARLDVPISGVDPDGDRLSFFLSNNPAFVSIFDNGNGTGLIRIAPGSNDAGTYAIGVIVRDAGSPPLEDSRTFTLRVRPPNRAPTLTPIGDQAIDVGQSRTVMIMATDADGDAIRLTLGGAPPFVTLTDNGDGTGHLRITSALSNLGGFPNITITATDNGVPSLSASETITVRVRPVITLVGFESNVLVTQILVDGTGFFTGDARVEVSGVPLETTLYRQQQPDGTAARLLGRDPRIAELLPPGATVQITVFDTRRQVRSAPVAFTR